MRGRLRGLGSKLSGTTGMVSHLHTTLLLCACQSTFHDGVHDGGPATSRRKAPDPKLGWQEGDMPPDQLTGKDTLLGAVKELTSVIFTFCNIHSECCHALRLSLTYGQPLSIQEQLGESSLPLHDCVFTKTPKETQFGKQVRAAPVDQGVALKVSLPFYSRETLPMASPF